MSDPGAMRPIDVAAEWFAIAFSVLLIVVAWGEDRVLAGVFCLGTGATALLLGLRGLRDARRGIELPELEDVPHVMRGPIRARAQAMRRPERLVVGAAFLLTLAAGAFITA